MAEVGALARELPVLRDPDASYYVRQEGGGLLVGPFERDPKPWALDGIPEDFHGRLLPPDLDQIEAPLVAAAARVPAFAERGHPVVGQRARRLHARRPLPDGAGARPAGLPRAGRLLDLRDRLRRRRRPLRRRVDRRRPAERQHVGARRAPLRRLRERRSRTSSPRASEVYEREYAIHYPEEELPAGRPLKTDPLYDRLAARGAVFGVAVRLGAAALVLEAAGRRATSTRSGAATGSTPSARSAARSARRVGVLDQTSFAKFRVEGPGAEEWLDRVVANRVPSEPGRIALDAGLPAGRWDRVRPDGDAGRRGGLLRRLRGRDRGARLRVAARRSSTATTCGSRT